MKLVETKKGTIIEVFVKPNQPRFEFRVTVEEILVCSTEEPTKGRVNKEIVRELTKFFHSNVELVSSSTSRQKKFLIGLKRNKVEEFLANKT